MLTWGVGGGDTDGGTDRGTGEVKLINSEVDLTFLVPAHALLSVGLLRFTNLPRKSSFSLFLLSSNYMLPGNSLI